MVKVKICGLTNVEDASMACDYGADFLGFIFVKGTPRYVEDIREIISDLPPEVKEKTGRVGLFRNGKVEEVAGTVAGCDLDYVQLHGEERPDYCRALKQILLEKYHLSAKIIKTFKIGGRILSQWRYGPRDYEQVDYFVFDTFHPEISGGTGRSFDWQVLIKEREGIKKPFFIAGGLTPENVASAVKTVRPYGVDVSSGVEDFPGKKDKNLLKEFIENAKKAQTAR